MHAFRMLSRVGCSPKVMDWRCWAVRVLASPFCSTKCTSGCLRKISVAIKMDGLKYHGMRIGIPSLRAIPQNDSHCSIAGYLIDAAVRVSMIPILDTTHATKTYGDFSTSIHEQFVEKVLP